jgi:signal transduction histidine kinase
MLSMIGEKNGRLYQVLRHEPERRRPRANVLAELERERGRIARELHAGAGQPLAGIKLNLEMLDNWAAGLPPEGRDALARLQALTEQALNQVRSVSHGLHPPEWQGLTTAEAIRYLVQSSGIAASLEVETAIEPLPDEPPHAVKVVLYRCAQECIANVVRHSGATRLSLTLRPLPVSFSTMIELRVEDNGHGFQPDTPGRKGIGLTAIREHAESLGGACNVLSNPLGVTVVVRLPLAVD